MGTLRNSALMHSSSMSPRGVVCDARLSLRGARGFTLVEVIMAITILAILLVIAVPSMTALVRDQRVKAATFDVFSAFAFARSEAIKRNANVVITPNAIDWGSGW